MGDWPYWVFGGLTVLAGVALAVWSLLGDRARGRVLCPRCWYDMLGVPGDDAGARRCPECGTATASARRLGRTRRRWRWAAVGLLVLAGGVALFDYPNLRAGGWQQRLPTTALILLLPHVEETWAVDLLAERLYGHGQPGASIARPLPRWQRGLLVNRVLAAARAGRPRGGGLVHMVRFADDPRGYIPTILDLLSSEDEQVRWAAVGCLYWFRYDMDQDQIAMALGAIESVDATSEQMRYHLDTARTVLTKAIEQNQASVHTKPADPPPSAAELAERLDGATARDSLVQYRALGVPFARKFFLPYSLDAGPLQAAMIEVDLNGDGRQDAVVRVGDSEGVHWDLHVFLDEAGGSRYIGTLGTSTNRLGTPEVRIETTPGGRVWLVLRTLLGADGIGMYQLWGDIWYSVDRSGLRLVGSFPTDGRSLCNGPAGATDWVWRANQWRADGGASVRYTFEACFHPSLDSALLFASQKPRQPDGAVALRLTGYADLVWSRRKRVFQSDYSRSPWSVDPLDVLLGTPDDFLRHNTAALVRLAETGDDRQRRWLASLLSTCGRTPERAEVEAALGGD